MRNTSLAVHLFLSSTLYLGGCTSNDASPADMQGPDPLGGGTIRLASCGYAVTTRQGASPPVMGSAKLGPDPTPFALHLGLAADPAHSMVLSWRTRDDATLATRVQYGTSDPPDQSVDGLTFTFQADNNGPAVRMHEAHLCGLLPDTQYSYRVGGLGDGGKEVYSPVYTFRTAPDPALHPMTQVVIAVLGDTRGGYPIWGQALKQAQQLGTPDLLLFSGDAVTLGTIQSDWDAYFQAAEPVLRTVPMLLAHGNHEANAINYYSQFALPGDEEDYSINYGPAHITVLNDTPADVTALKGKAAQFLDADLFSADKAPWKLLMHHRGFWSSASHGSNMDVRDAWGTIVDAHKVDLVLNGHDHDYERTKPMRGMTPQASPADGTVYIVSGSAGAPLYDNGTSFFTQISQKTYSLLILRIRQGELDMVAYKEDGTELDSMIITKK